MESPGIILSGLLIILTVQVNYAVADYASYNSATELCCNGTVFDKSSGVECCASQPYNTLNFLCCDGQFLQPLSRSHNVTTLECCIDGSGAASLYDYKTQQCCQGSVVDKPNPDDLYGCCQGALYAYSDQLCCGGKVQERRGNDSCCVDQVYDTTNQTCCKQWGRVNGSISLTSHQVFDHQGGATECCGSCGLHDPSLSICCDGEVKQLPIGASSSDEADCCNGEPYNVELNTCCDKWSPDGENKLKLDAYKIQRKLHGRWGTMCCGLEIFDYKTETCCGQTIHAIPRGTNQTDLCCGERLIAEPDIEICSNGTIVHRNGSDMFACGSQLYDAVTQVCCNDEVVALDSDLECCWGAKRAYNKEREMCCGTEVVAINEDKKIGSKDACCFPTIPTPD